MHFYGKAKDTATRFLDAFREGKVPAALAQVLLPPPVDYERPCKHWSTANQLLTALAGTIDARGYRQWQEVGRHVKAGARAFHILGPSLRKIKSDEPGADDDAHGERVALVGFHAIPVFRAEDTEGEPLPTDNETRAYLDTLPLLNVAQAWNLSVVSMDPELRKVYQGTYQPTLDKISLKVKSLQIWCHELTHAADNRLTPDGLKAGQHADQEIVAELGGAVLLHMIGQPDAADLGTVWPYIQRYADDSETKALALAFELLDRTCKAVSLILQTAGEAQPAPATPEPAALATA